MVAAKNSISSLEVAAAIQESGTQHIAEHAGVDGRTICGEIELFGNLMRRSGDRLVLGLKATKFCDRGAGAGMAAPQDGKDNSILKTNMSGPAGSYDGNQTASKITVNWPG